MDELSASLPAPAPRSRAKLVRRRAEPPPLLFIPGIGSTGPAHWLNIWTTALPEAERVEQDEWVRPSLADWTATLAEAVRRRPGSVLVAHSLGCALVAHLLSVTRGRGVRGAFLVAPADVGLLTASGRVGEGFSPMPDGALAAPSVVVASRNDPYVSLARARSYADGWGSAFIDAGHAGHINVASGHGPWPEGRRLLSTFVSDIADGRIAA